MAYSSNLADSRVKSQSDSDLLNPNSDEGRGRFRRNSSMDDMDTSKKKGFLYHLVRPWKWHRKKKKSTGSRDDGGGRKRGQSLEIMEIIGQLIEL